MYTIYTLFKKGHIRSSGVSLFGSFSNFKFSVWTLFYLNVLESLIVIRSCLQSELGLVNALKWGLLTLFCGFSALSKVLLFGRSFIVSKDRSVEADNSSSKNLTNKDHNKTHDSAALLTTTNTTSTPSSQQAGNGEKSESAKKRKKSGSKKKKP
jgi:hypothetical protein